MSEEERRYKVQAGRHDRTHSSTANDVEGRDSKNGRSAAYSVISGGKNKHVRRGDAPRHTHDTRTAR